MSSMLFWNHSLQKNDVWQVLAYKTKEAQCIPAPLGASLVAATSLGSDSCDGGGAGMLKNQILRIRIFFSIREVQKAGTLQPMCSQQFASTLRSPFGHATDRPKPLGVDFFDTGGAETKVEGRRGGGKNAPWMK